MNKVESMIFCMKQIFETKNRDIDHLRMSFEDSENMIIPPNLRGLIGDCWIYDWRERIERTERVEVHCEFLVAKYK